MKLPFLLLIFILASYSLKAMDSNNNSRIRELSCCKPVCAFVSSIITTFYQQHSLTKEIENIEFYVSNDKTMIPKSSITPQGFIALTDEDKSFIAEGTNSQTHAECIILSPCIYTLLKRSFLRCDDNKFYLCTSHFVAFQLLNILSKKKIRLWYPTFTQEKLNDISIRLTFAIMYPFQN